MTFWKAWNVFAIFQASFFLMYAAYNIGANSPSALPYPFTHGNMIIMEWIVIILAVIQLVRDEE